MSESSISRKCLQKKVAKVAIENDQNNSYQDESSNDISNNKMEGDHKSKVAKNAKKVATKYHCNICDYISSNKYNYEKHIISNIMKKYQQ